MSNKETIRNKILVRIAKGMDITLICKELNVKQDVVLDLEKTAKDEIEIIRVSLEIRRLIRENNYEEALFLSSKKCFLDNPVIASQRINILYNLKRYGEALKICDRPSLVHNADIKSQKIGILIAIKKYDEALFIASKEEYLEHKAIQFYRARLLVLLNRYGEAYEIYTKKQYRTDESFQAELIRLLFNFGKYIEILLIAERPEFYNSSMIQGLMAKTWLKLGKEKEALKIINRKEFKYKANVQIVMIELLLNKRRYEEALEMCNLKEFQGQFNIQLKKIDALIGLYRYSEALRVCNCKILRDNELANTLKYVIPYLSDFRMRELDEFENSIYQQYLRLVKDKELELAEIRALDESEEVKDILTMAYYEVNNFHKDVIMYYLKNMQKKYEEVSMISIIERLKARFKVKVKYFDNDFYYELLKLTGKLKQENGLVRKK